MFNALGYIKLFFPTKLVYAIDVDIISFSGKTLKVQEYSWRYTQARDRDLGILQRAVQMSILAPLLLLIHCKRNQVQHASTGRLELNS